MNKEYWKLAGFENIYLEDSYVLKFSETPSFIEFELDLVLTENHPLYSTPKKEEQYCYKAAKLRFENLKGVKWLERTFRPIPDATGSIDYGNIDSFTYSNATYKLSGGWGNVEIISLAPIMEIQK